MPPKRTEACGSDRAKQPELERQQAYVALDLREWKQADELTDDVIARSPDDEATLRLARIRDVHKMSELRISGTQDLL